MTTGNQLIRITKILFVLLVTAVVGCGSPYQPITGEVSCDGAPLPHGRVTFYQQGHRDVVGSIDNGKIVDVTTSNTGDGMLLGEYRVGIYSFVRKPVGMEMVPSAIDKKYNSPSTSGLTIEVTNSGENHFTFELDPPSK